MKFKNIRTGIVLELPDNFSGKYWEPVEQPTPKEPEAKKKPKKKAR